MGGFSGFTAGIRALRAAQLALETTGHNIANANTPGYSRQRVELVEALPDLTPWGVKGTGVEIARIARIREGFLDIQLRNETKLLGQWEEIEKFLSRLELYFNEPSDEGLNKLLSEFWGRWEDLSLTPEEQTSRSNVLHQSEMLTAHLNMLYEKIQGLRYDADEAIKAYIQEINSLASNIASLNDRIRFYEVGDFVANDLRDQRDEMLRRLSELIDFTTEEQPDGTVLVSVGGVNLVDRVSATTITYRYNEEGHVVPIWEMNNAPVQARAGKLKGAMIARDVKIPAYLDRVNQIARTLIVEVNRQHTQGWGLEGFSSLTSSYALQDADASISSSDSGLDFYDVVSDGSFVITVKDTAGNTLSANTISITSGAGGTSANDIITAIGSDFSSGISHLRAYLDSDGHLHVEAEDGYRFFLNQDGSGALTALGLNVFFKGNSAGTIAVSDPIASNVKYISASASGEIGDGNNAIAIARLKDADLMEGGSATIYDYYASTLGMMGVDKREADNMKEAQETLITHIKNSIEEISGVSLDEEAMNLMRFQRAYEAAAKYINAVDELLDILINEVAG